ncbi:MAG: hypothetical protein DRH57_06925 [Candidatus Cloacimonadota bacterium]|nr:MAG: hypothetical protein DRH57_06925 [Candidatus Cloacimonadota bacterium]
MFSLKKKWFLIYLSSFVIFSLFIISCQVKNIGRGKQSEVIDTSAVLAEFDGGKITKKQLEDRIEQIPPMYKKQFQSVEAKKKFLDNMVTEELFYMEAKKIRLDNDENVLEQFNKQKKQALQQAYYEKEIENKAKVSDSDIEKYYSEHKDEFIEKPTAEILHIQTSEKRKAEEALEKLKQGEDFKKVVEQYSTNKFSKSKGGRIKKIYDEGIVPGIGTAKELNKMIFSAKIDSIYGPILDKENYHIFKLIKRTPARPKELKEVKNKIKVKLEPKKRETILNSVYNYLTKKYNTIIDTSLLQELDITSTDSSNYHNENLLVSSDIDELNISIGDYYTDLKGMPSYQIDRLKDKRERVIDFINRKVKPVLYYHEAEKNNYENDPETKKKLEQIKRLSMLRECYKKLIVDSLNITDDTLRKYYEEEKDSKYKIREQAKVREFVLKDRKTAKKVRNLALKTKTDEELDKLVEKYSLNKKRKGDLGIVYKDGPISNHGQDKSYNENIFKTQEGKFSEIFQNKDGNYVFVKVKEYTPSGYREFSEIKDNLKSGLQRKLGQKRFELVTKQLENKYHVKKYPELLEDILPLEKLKELAEKSQTDNKPYEAIKYYKQIEKYYKNGSDDYNAVFMQAFIYSEMLNKKETALELLHHLINDFPNGDLHDDAQYMIDEINGKNTILEKLNTEAKKAKKEK